jgi:hypothetical protein
MIYWWGWAEDGIDVPSLSNHACMHKYINIYINNIIHHVLFYFLRGHLELVIV